MPNTRKNVEKSDATHAENTEDTVSDCNMIMDKILEEFKTYIITELTQNVKHIIPTEIQGILEGYKEQLKKFNSTVEMLQQHVSSLKRENSVLEDKVKMYHQEFVSRCDESEQYNRRFFQRKKYQENE